MLDKLTHEDFATCLDQPFHIHYGEDESITTTLVQVTPWGPAPTDASQRRQPFSLLFRGRQDGYLPQRIYRVENETLGSVEIFLVPLGPDDGEMQYEVVFT